MALSVAANAGGNGLANLFRHARPVKLAEEPAGNGEAPATILSLRPLGRTGIDSTGSGTAQVSAAITQYLARLGGSDEAPAKPAATTAPSASRSSAAELMRVLDAYTGAEPSNGG